MTEQTLPGAGTAVAEPPAPEFPFDGNEAEGGDNRRKLMLVGAAVAVLVLAAAGYFLLKGGSSTPTSSAAPLPAPAPSSPATHHATKPLTLPKKFNGHVGRDPFKPLYVEPAAPTTGGGSTTTGSTTGSSSTDTSTGTTTPTGTTTTPHVRTYHPVWIQLKSWTTKSATFIVGYSNGKSLKGVRFVVNAPKSGSSTTFAKTFALLKLTKTEVMLQFGDGTPFILDKTHNMMVVN